MTEEEFKALFEKHEDDFLKFKKIVDPICNRPDICGFLLLDKLDPGKADMVCAAEHDEIFLDANISVVAKNATEEDVIYLVRCGVRIDPFNDNFAMFV